MPSQALRPGNPAFASTTNYPPRCGPFDESADAQKDIAAALKRAPADRKLVLLDFGANWCPDCIALSRLFQDDTVKPFCTDNFHLVKINVGRKDQNQDLCVKYDAPVAKVIPALVVRSAEGQVLAATHGGELANARTATAADFFDHLKRWRAIKPNP